MVAVVTVASVASVAKGSSVARGRAWRGGEGRERRACTLNEEGCDAQKALGRRQVQRRPAVVIAQVDVVAAVGRDQPPEPRNVTPGGGLAHVARRVALPLLPVHHAHAAARPRRS